MDIHNASEPVEVWLLESPQQQEQLLVTADGPGLTTTTTITTPSSSTPGGTASVSERKKKRGSFFSKLFCSSDVVRSTNHHRSSRTTNQSSPAADTVDSQSSSRRSTSLFSSSSSPLPSPASSLGATEYTETQSMPAMTTTTASTPPRSLAKSFSTPRGSQRKSAPATAAMKTPGMPIPSPQANTYSLPSKTSYRKMSDTSSGEHDVVSTPERCGWRVPSEELDDDDFLPDEFKGTLLTSKSSADRDSNSSIPDRLYSADQVQVIVNEALHQAHEEWQQTILLRAQEDHRKAMTKIQMESEAMLEERRNSWTRQHEQELEQMRNKLEDDIEQLAKRHEQEKVDLQLQLTKEKEAQVQELQSAVSGLTESKATEREMLEKQIEDLNATVVAVQNQFATETDALRKELELSEAKNEDLLDKQLHLDMVKGMDNVVTEDHLEEKAQLEKKLADLEQENLRIKLELDRQLEQVRDEAMLEKQRLQEEFQQKLEQEKASAQRSIPVENEMEEQLHALKVEHTQELEQQRHALMVEHEQTMKEQLTALKQDHANEIQQQLDDLKLEHSKFIERLHQEADQRIVQANQDFQTIQMDLRSTIEKEWSEERKQLQELISDLESKIISEQTNLEASLESLKLVHSNEIVEIQKKALEDHDRLQREIMEQADKQQKEKDSKLHDLGLKEKQLVEEIEMLQQEKAALQSEHEAIIVSLKDDHSQKVDRLKILVDEAHVDAETKFNNARQLSETSLQEAHNKEKQDLLATIDSLKSSMDTMRADHDRIIANLQKEHEEMDQKLRQSMDEQLASLSLDLDQQTKLSLQQAGLLVQATSEKNQLKEALAKLESELIQQRLQHEESVSLMTINNQNQLDQIRNEADEAVARVRSERSQNESSLETMSQEKKQTAELVLKLQEDIACLRSQLDQNKHDMDESSAREQSLLSKFAALEARTDADRSEFERQLRERQELTNKEIEETIAQLDLLVLEHNQERDRLERSVQDKDAIIAALGAQLAEAQRRMTALEEAHVQYGRELEAAKHDACMAQEAVESLKASVEHMKADHKKAMEAEHAKRIKAQEQAREETIAEAESQFQRANDIYIQLKKEYDASCHKISKLEVDLKNARNEIEQARQERASKEIELTAELAQVKACLATSEADTARQIKEYTLMLNQLQAKEKEVTVKLDEAHANVRTTHITLAAVVAEKERLIRENEEMKAVCEELMVMVEGQQQSNP